MQFRRKPLLVAATQWHKPGDHPAVELTRAGRGKLLNRRGSHKVLPGDWIVEHEGRCHVVEGDLFLGLYGGGKVVEQLILHLIGDYVTQSDWMANSKTGSTWAAFCHATVYSLPFFFLAGSKAVLVIWLTHLLIDRFRLARYVVFAKNFLGRPWPQWENCKVTGYPSERPAWLAVWLLIAADNTLHLAINYSALRWL